MVFRRRTTFRRRKLKKYTKRKVSRFYKPSSRALSRYKFYNYKQTVDGVSLTGIGARYIQQTAGAQNFAVEFRADSLANWTTLSALYDQYRINKVVLKLIPMMNVSNANVATSSAQNPGLIMSVLDYDDSTPLAALTDYFQYANFKQQPMISGRVHTRILTPCVRDIMLNSGGASVAAGVKKRQWIDCSQGAITHNGVKIYMDPWYSVNSAQTYQVIATYYVSFRGVR